MSKQYIYAEPDQVTRYKDRFGETHLTRDDAIAANVQGDLQDALYAASDMSYALYKEVTAEELTRFLQRNKELVLHILGER